MAITFEDLGADEQLGRRVLVIARTIAPCLDSLVDEPRADAIAVLRGVVADVRSNGPRGIASQSIGPARVEYRVTEDSFTREARASLRSLCGLGAASGLPLGSFPAAGVISRLWPEAGY